MSVSAGVKRRGAEQTRNRGEQERIRGEQERIRGEQERVQSVKRETRGNGPQTSSSREEARALDQRRAAAADFSLLKRLARDQLIFLLEQLPGKKDLFIDADLMSPLDRIANVSTLKEHEVDKLYKVEHRSVVSTADQSVSLSLLFLKR
ncbi:hypothetical protein WMY93_032772 [Mugilogobius chulae]|uniref:Uncharacterized protein n=1 Tax=Mugilogobius chulae TaxID=88201 RepID=A0AAW0MQJ4_9GOBI